MSNLTLHQVCLDALRKDFGELFSDIQHQLYHYTDLVGMQGIVEKKVLFATNAAFLNDKTETYHGRNLLTIHTMPQELDSDRRASIRKLLDQKLRSTPIDTVYTLSFSRKEDSLSQWRGYGKKANGYCLEFSFHDLWRAMGDTGEFLNVIYDPPTQHKVASCILKAAFNFIEESEADETSLAAQLSEVIAVLHLVIPALKQPGFSEEEEVRFVVKAGVLPIQALQLKFRPGPGYLVPYVELPYLKGARDSSDYALRQIFVGPQNDLILARESLQMFLSEMSLPAVAINWSEIPLR